MIGMIGMVGSAALPLSIGLLCARRIDTAMQLCALQALAAAASLGETTAMIALLAFVLNGVALPVAIARLDKAARLVPRGNALMSWTTVLTVLVATAVAFAGVGMGGSVALGVSVTLLGLLLIMLRSHALPVGLLSSQNGLVLVASAHPDVSQAAVLAAAVPFVPALVMADNWLRR